MWIKYFVPEDGDDANHPNVFQAEKVNTLEDIKRAFPLSGSYHFRFLKEIDKMIVWLDVVESNSQIPTFQGGIFIKANRLRNAQLADVRPHHRTAPVPAAAEQVSSSSAPARTASVPAPAPAPAQKTRQNSEKLLSFDHHDDDFSNAPSQPSPVPVAQAATKTSENLLDDSDDFFSTTTTNSTSQKSSSNADLFGLDTLQPVATPMSSMGAASNPMSGAYFPSQPMVGNSGPRPAGGSSMNPMMGGNMGNNMPRPMGAPMGGAAPRPMGGMNQQQGQYNRPAQGMGGAGGYDPFSNLGGMQRK